MSEYIQWLVSTAEYPCMITGATIGDYMAPDVRSPLHQPAQFQCSTHLCSNPGVFSVTANSGCLDSSDSVQWLVGGKNPLVMR